MRVTVSPLAERDLETIGDYIAEDNPARALSFVAELRAQCTKIAKEIINGSEWISSEIDSHSFVHGS